MSEKKTDKIYPAIDLRCSSEFKRELAVRSNTYGMSPSEYIRMLIVYSFNTDAHTMMNIKSQYRELLEVRKPRYGDKK